VPDRKTAPYLFPLYIILTNSMKQSTYEADDSRYAGQEVSTCM